MKRLAYKTFWVMLTLTALWLLWNLRIAVLLFLLALATASAFRPLVRAFTRRGISHDLSVVLGYAAGLLVLAMTVAAIGPALLEDSRRLVDDGSGFLRASLAGIQEERGLLSNDLISSLVADFTEIDAAFIREAMPEVASVVIGVTSSAFSTLGYFGLVIVISIYWSIDRGDLERWGFEQIWPQWRGWARQGWERCWTLIGEAVRAELLSSLTLVLALWGLYATFGVPYESVFALWAGIARVVPWLGVVLAFIPLLASGLATAQILLVLALGLLIYFLIERIWQRAILGYQRPSRLFTGILILALGKVYGVIGVIMAPPVAAVVHELLRLLTPVGGRGRQITEPGWDLAEIQDRLTRISSKELEGLQDEHSRRRADLVTRVEDLRVEVERLLNERRAADRST